jgi:hypothetical protein
VGGSVCIYGGVAFAFIEKRGVSTVVGAGLQGFGNVVVVVGSWCDWSSRDDRKPASKSPMLIDLDYPHNSICWNP